MRSILAPLLALIMPIRHTPHDPAPNVRPAVVVAAKRLRESSQASRETQTIVRETMRPIEELLKEMGGDREGSA